MEQQYYKQKKILLVDDEKALLDMVADFLREDGYRCRCNRRGKNMEAGFRDPRRHAAGRRRLFAV